MASKYLAVPENQFIEVELIKYKKRLFGGRKYLVAYKQTMMDGDKTLYTIAKLTRVDALYEEKDGVLKEVDTKEK